MKYEYRTIAEIINARKKHLCAADICNQLGLEFSILEAYENAIWQVADLILQRENKKTISLEKLAEETHLSKECLKLIIKEYGLKTRYLRYQRLSS